ncbi:hypothetical protein Agub_g452, partial [Astrephomene gubernaculifera]
IKLLCGVKLFAGGIILNHWLHCHRGDAPPVRLLFGFQAARVSQGHIHPPSVVPQHVVRHRQVLDRYEGSELRRYDPATFTSTVLSLDEEGSIERAAVKGFHRLLKYNLGDNEDSQKVSMTAPVLYGLDVDRTASKRHDLRFADRFSVSFFVPFRFQDKPPSPSDPDVFLVDAEEKDIFVRSFGGYATGARITHIASEFLRDLYDDGHRVDCRTIYIAQYSPPFQPVFRYNEVWVLRRRRHGKDATDGASDAAGEGDCGDWLKPEAAGGEGGGEALEEEAQALDAIAAAVAEARAKEEEVVQVVKADGGSSEEHLVQASA